MPQKKHYVQIGEIYGKWTVLEKELSFRNPSGKMVSKVLCECICGSKGNIEIWALVSGRKKNCKKCGDLKKLGHIPWNKNKVGVMPVPWNKYKSGYSTSKKGKKYGPLSKERSISFREKMSGENSPFWIKDRTKLQRYGDAQNDRRSSAYHAWRHQVKIRDNFVCKMNNQDCKGRLEVHHILSYTNYPELRFDINNGIALCNFHHPRKKEEEKRLSPYFQELITKIN